MTFIVKLTSSFIKQKHFNNLKVEFYNICKIIYGLEYLNLYFHTPFFLTKESTFICNKIVRG